MINVQLLISEYFSWYSITLCSEVLPELPSKFFIQLAKPPTSEHRLSLE